MFKRLFLFLALNIAIVLTVSFFLHLFHVGPYLTRFGVDYKMLALFCFIWGMTGALISLLLSKQVAKWIFNISIIDPHNRSGEHKMLLEMVERLSQRAFLPEVPEIGVFDSTTPNAFATGPSKRHALVACSTGLLRELSKEEIEAVLAHEISHISNGDMITMTLLQGVVNSFVLFLSRALALILSGFGKENRKEGSYAGYALLSFLFEIVFMILGSLIVAFYSRGREFRADLGSKELVGREPMINALRRLGNYYDQAYKYGRETLRESPLTALMIVNSRKRKSLIELLHSHPSIEERIENLMKN